jgi:endo-beta-N-acetylglucosaminidase D
MKPTQSIALVSLICVGLFGCSTADPRITGNPADWRGKPSATLVQFQGEPQRVVKDADGSELWEYYNAHDMIIPKGENTSFFGGGNNYGLGGAFSSEKRPEDRTAHVEDTMRFKIQHGVIVAIFSSRVVDGRVVRQNHW